MSFDIDPAHFLFPLTDEIQRQLIEELDAIPNVGAATSNPNRPYQVHFLVENPVFLKYFLSRPDFEPGKDFLHLAAACGNQCRPETIDVLVRYGYDPNAKDEHGRFPFELAYHGVETPALRALIRNGATLTDEIRDRIFFQSGRQDDDPYMNAFYALCERSRVPWCFWYVAPARTVLRLVEHSFRA